MLGIGLFRHLFLSYQQNLHFEEKENIGRNQLLNKFHEPNPYNFGSQTKLAIDEEVKRFKS